VFPIDALPAFVRPLSYILPPTWAVKIIRESSLGINDYVMFYREMLILIFISIVYLLMSRVLFLKIDKHTRIKATLGVS
jgi:ABC-2 type transport system permease protein